MASKRNNPFSEDSENRVREATVFFDSLKKRKISRRGETIAGNEIFTLTKSNAEKKSKADIVSEIFNSDKYPILKATVKESVIQKIGERFPSIDFDAKEIGKGAYGVVKELGEDKNSKSKYVIKIQLLKKYETIGGDSDEIEKSNKEALDSVDGEESFFKEMSDTAEFFSKIGYSEKSKAAIGISMHEKYPFWIRRFIEQDNDTQNIYGISLGFTVMKKGITFANVLRALSKNPKISVDQRDTFLFEAYKELYLKINALHKFGYIHGDIKVDNIVFSDVSDEKNQVQLVPFLIDWDLLNYGSEMEDGLPAAVVYAIQTPGVLMEFIPEALDFRYGAKDKQQFVDQIKERWTRADLVIFQMLANLIRDKKRYRELIDNFNVAFSEINSITIEKFSTPYKREFTYTKPALAKKEVVLLLKPV